MKKFYINILAGLLALFAIVAIAGSVYDRAAVTLGRATGTATYTNSYNYAAVILKNIWISGDYDATSTVTVKRVTSDSAYTGTVGTVVCTGGAGNTTSFTASYMKKGDMLTFANSTATGAVALIEFEVQQH